MGLYQAIHHGTIRDDVRRRHLVHAVLGAGLHGGAAADRASSACTSTCSSPTSPAGSRRWAGCFADLERAGAAGGRARRSTAWPASASTCGRRPSRCWPRTTSGPRGLRDCRERLILTRHVLRNALLPVVTILGLSLPDIVAGAVIAEAIFNFPGMGLLFWQSALAPRLPGAARRDADHRGGDRRRQSRRRHRLRRPRSEDPACSRLTAASVARPLSARPRRWREPARQPRQEPASDDVPAQQARHGRLRARACCWSCSASSGR